MWLGCLCGLWSTRFFLYTSNDRDRLDQSLEELRDFYFNNETAFEIAGVPVLILLNKQDLPNAMPPQEIVARIRERVPELAERMVRALSAAHAGLSCLCPLLR